jgi:hypothetical protein
MDEAPQLLRGLKIDRRALLAHRTSGPLQHGGKRSNGPIDIFGYRRIANGCGKRDTQVLKSHGLSEVAERPMHQRIGGSGEDRMGEAKIGDAAGDGAGGQRMAQRAGVPRRSHAG